MGHTDANGKLTISPHLYVPGAAFEVWGGATNASYAVPVVDPGEGDLDMGMRVSPTLPQSGTAWPSANTAGDVTSGDLTLHITAQTTVNILSLWKTPADQGLRVLSVDPAHAPIQADNPNSLQFSQLYVVSPYRTTFDPGIRISVANTQKLAAGTIVEFYSLECDLTDIFCATPRMDKIDEGTVSGDGKMITTEGANSFRSLSWIGLRVKP